MRRMTVFPLISAAILLVGQVLCFMGHCNTKRKLHTFAAGILYVIGGAYVTLVYSKHVPRDVNSNNTRPSA